MQQDLIHLLKVNPDYQKLVATRSRFGWTLTWIMMAVYYGFILLIAFDKEFLSTRIGDGVMTWGMPLGLFVIVFTVLITGIYVRRANGEFDELTAAIRKQVLK
ncbi:MAG TPA: DUF485 domain-containing protein [Janthinobacterium sp.]|nr:DUF485 domain-containing protein [Janthinobacterium sp.]